MIKVGDRVYVEMQGTVEKIWQNERGHSETVVCLKNGQFIRADMFDLLEVGESYDTANDGPEVDILRQPAPISAKKYGLFFRSVIDGVQHRSAEYPQTFFSLKEANKAIEEVPSKDQYWMEYYVQEIQ